MATHDEIRSCVLAGIYSLPGCRLTVYPGEFGKTMHELRVEQFPRHKVRRALDSLAHSDVPGRHRLDRYALGDGVRVYIARDTPKHVSDSRRSRWQFAY